MGTIALALWPLGTNAMVRDAVPAQRTAPATETPEPTVTGGARTATPHPTPTALPSGPAAWLPSGLAAAAQAWLPALTKPSSIGICSASLVVQNAGPDTAKAILVVWGEATAEECPVGCPGPLKLECSGLLKPGASWTFRESQMPTDAVSGAVYSFTTKTLREIGVGLGVDDLVADYMCETLFFGILGDCIDDVAFRQAFNSGAAFAGIPMSKTYGGPLVAQVRRECPGNADAPGAEAAYEGVGGADLGRPAPADPTSTRFTYHLPALDLDAGGSNSLVSIQNAGFECATATLRFKVEDDCDAVRDCGTFAIPSGMTRIVDATACGGPNLRGSGWLEADQPLAVVVDTVLRVRGAGLPASLTSYVGVARSQPPEAPNADVALYGSLPLWDATAWSGQARVQNLSPDTNAQAKIYSMDRGGDVIAVGEAQICPGGSHAFDLSRLFGPGTNWVGSIRIESQEWWTPGTPVIRPPQIAGVVTLWQTTQSGTQQMTYPLQPFNLDAAAKGDNRLLAVPLLQKNRDGYTTELAIQNLIAKPGSTDVAIYIYDQNGLLDFVCQKLNEKAVEYIDLATWGYVNSGFRGAAMIEAQHWRHEVFNAQGQWVDNLIGLGAMTLLRGNRSGNLGTDTSVASVAVPIDIELAQGGPSGNAAPLCPGVPTRTPTPAVSTPQVTATPRLTVSSPPPVTLTPGTGTPSPVASETSTGPQPFTPTSTAVATATSPVYRPYRIHLPWVVQSGRDEPTATPATGPATQTPWVVTATPPPSATHSGPPTPRPTAAGRVPKPDELHLPVVNFLGDEDVCRTTIAVQHLGGEPSKVVLVSWGEPGFCPPQCAGPLKVECSGLLAPGGNWRFSGSRVPTGTRSAALYSFTALTGTELGIGIVGEDVVADYMCQSLFFGVVGDCNDYRRFKLAYDTGAEFAFVPVGRAWGAPIAATVQRFCPGGGTPGFTAVDDYPALRESAIQSFDTVHATFGYYAPLLFGQRSGFHSQMYLQNAGLDCASLEIWLGAQEDCLARRICEVLSVGPGESVTFDVAACAGANWQGSAWVRSSQPVAVVVDTQRHDTLASTTGAAAFTGSPSQGELRWFAPLVFDDAHGWDVLVQVQNQSASGNARVKVQLVNGGGEVVQTLTDFVCPRGSQTFFFPITATEAGPGAASVRVLSEPYSTGPDTPPAKPWPVSGSVTMVQYPDTARSRSTAQLAYDLLPASALLDYDAHPSDGATSGAAGRMALPAVYRDPSGWGLETELAITNLVEDRAGVTRYQVRFMDGEDVVATVCGEVAAGALRYYDVSDLAAVLPPAFRGSAIVSATWWNHLDPRPGVAINSLGLAATAVQRVDPRYRLPMGDFSAEPGIPWVGSVPEADVTCP